MQFERGFRPLVGIGSLFGLAWVLLTFTTVRVVQSDGSLFSRRIGLVISAVLALTLFAGVLGVHRYDLMSQADRIAGWTYLGASAVGLAVIVNTQTLEFVRPGYAIALYMVTSAVAAGSVLGFAIGLYDAHQTQNKHALDVKQSEAERLSNRLSVLNRVLRHDIRTQAQLLQGYTERMGTDELPSETAAQKIQRTTERLTTLSDEARKLQHLFDENGFETETIDIVSSIDDATQTVTETQKDLAVETELPDEQLVEASPMLTEALEQVLHNVAEHTEVAEPRAKITVRSGGPPAQSVQLTISDNGPGIDELEKIHNTGACESQLHHSMGLGLWLVTWIVDEGNGDLEIRSPETQDTGTIVTITLPRSAG
jgi:signal transduction histidine kinase